MARFLSINTGIFVLTAALTVLQAQTVRPTAPSQRPAPQATGAPRMPQPQTPAALATPTPPGAAAQPTQPASQPGSAGPPVAPVVTFRDGLLTVQALNSNLSSVVTAIRNKTGIEFEGAENVSERVAISMGPAPEGEILAAIFSGSKYDFLAIGRPDSPTIVQKVILTVKNQPGAVGEAQPQPRPATQGDEEEAPDEQVNGGDPQDTPVQPVPVPQNQAPQAETPPNQQPKSPEQLLQELQQMRRDKGSPEDPTNNPNPAPRKVPPQ